MPGEFSVVVMDAGQGESLLVVFPDDSLIMVDCGSMKNKGIVKEPIIEVLNRYLPAAGNRLKALVLTHPDIDHYNLINEIIIQKNIPINYLIYGGDVNNYGNIAWWIRAHENNTADPRQITHVVKPGASHYSEAIISELSYDGGYGRVDVRILAANIGASANSKSIVLLITYGDINVFLMGDAPVETENFILANMNRTLLAEKHTLLKVGHHGSNYSSCNNWIKTINPEIAFISSDTRSFQGTSLPSSDTISRITGNNTLLEYFRDHYYIQYNAGNNCHDQVMTKLMLYTTLHLLVFAPNMTDFTSYGTTWYYSIINLGSSKQEVTVEPACGWENIFNQY